MYASENTFDRMENIDWSGQLILHAWFHHLKTGKNPHCYPEACMVLGEIAYWYRPGRNGRKRYHGKRLQLSYGQIAERLAMTKDTVKSATDYLEAKGVIRKTFETREVDGRKFANVLFIDLSIDRLEEISVMPQG